MADSAAAVHTAAVAEEAMAAEDMEGGQGEDMEVVAEATEVADMAVKAGRGTVAGQAMGVAEATVGAVGAVGATV